MTSDGDSPSSPDDDGSPVSDTPSSSRPPPERPTGESSGASDTRVGQPADANPETERDGEPVSPDETAPPISRQELPTGRGEDVGLDERDEPEERNGRRAPDPVPTAGSDQDASFVSRLWHAQTGPLFLLREVVTSVGAVVLVGLVLFAVSGVWPPMVAVESGSMEPHMHRGDLVFITEPGRYMPDATYGSTGIVTAETGAEVDYRTFGEAGSVIVYDDPDRSGPPIIHRAVFYVEAGENWYGRTDPEFVAADSCSELRNCPAPHAGFITKGDANGRYDQASGISKPVKPEWITGTARFRIPYLGWVRLGLADIVQSGSFGQLTTGMDSQLEREQFTTAVSRQLELRRAVVVIADSATPTTTVTSPPGRAQLV